MEAASPLVLSWGRCVVSVLGRSQTHGGEKALVFQEITLGQGRPDHTTAPSTLEPEAGAYGGFFSCPSFAEVPEVPYSTTKLRIYSRSFCRLHWGRKVLLSSKMDTLFCLISLKTPISLNIFTAFFTRQYVALSAYTATFLSVLVIRYLCNFCRYSGSGTGPLKLWMKMAAEL